MRGREKLCFSWQKNQELDTISVLPLAMCVFLCEPWQTRLIIDLEEA